MKLFILFTALLTLGLLNSCGKIIFREINCRGFEFDDELKWFAGNVGDILTLKNETDDSINFVIRDKYILHRTSYISDTGCGCHDRWGILLTAGNDTINMYSDSKYVEKQTANRYDNFYIKYNNTLSGFITEDKQIEINYSIDNVVFEQVLIFSYSHTEDNQFKKIVIAPEIGVAQLTDSKGNIWTNKNLETKLNVEWNSFDYSENTCE